jgi:hypothetical protein
MIKTKNPVIIDARTGAEEVLFFETFVEQRDSKQNKISYLLEVFKAQEIEGETTFVPILNAIPCEYKKQTWLNLFGNMTTNEFESQKDNLMIQQIDYNSAKYWGLKTEDLEIVA